jgi:putative hydrolase of the HAD superfamily
MAEWLQACALRNYFEHVIDSGKVGYEKPAPQIFQAALHAMSVAPEQAVYVGDIYSIDYLGAQRVGMHAVLMDVAAVYAHRNLLRIESLGELDQLVSKMNS